LLESDAKDDFQDPPQENTLNDWEVMQSEARTSRKRKKVQREATVREREVGGKKPFYIMVNAYGTSYGDGLGAWKAELNKLCLSLDPLVRDVCQQASSQNSNFEETSDRQLRIQWCYFRQIFDTFDWYTHVGMEV